MSTHKYLDKICAAVTALSLLLALAFMNGESLGIQPASAAMGYEARLFDTDQVHTIDIVMDGWDSFLETCENEEYAQCAVVIDGEAYKNTGIRAKGNTSLSMVSAMDSNRYSFKLEFDHYDSTRSYYGLDKLSLNNIIQDNTYMKDYLTYQMMGAFGVNAPLCSYVYITVNGEDWGLYLAVEGVEDAFLRRNHGTGNLYKPDSTGFGGGRGNGRDFSMGAFMDQNAEAPQVPGMEDAPPFGAPPDFQGGSPGEGREPPQSPGKSGGFGGGMGSDDVKLRYIDDNPDSYSNIFNNAKTDVTEADQARLIASLKSLSVGEDLETVLDTEEVLRYFVVHNFVCNGDSYTGSIVHNYYLYEENGRLSMIPWDYNLAYGTFQGGDASSMVNAPIDTPVSGGDSRPMSDWIFSSEAYTALYHQYFQEFLETTDYDALISETAELIAPYVEKDPTRFCTYEEFQTGVETLRSFCRLRSESVSGQLNGTIPSTSAGQAEDASQLVDASSLTLSDMGTMNQGGGPGGGGFKGGNSKSARPERRASGGDSQPPAPSEFSSDGESPVSEEGQTIKTLRQGPPGRPGDTGSGSPDSTPAPINGSALLLTAASIAVLSAAILYARLYQRRKR